MRDGGCLASQVKRILGWARGDSWEGEVRRVMGLGTLGEIFGKTPRETRAGCIGGSMRSKLYSCVAFDMSLSRPHACLVISPRWWFVIS